MVPKGEGEKHMSLIKCPECGKEISDSADNCPNCGHPLKKKAPAKKIVLWTVAGICGAVALFVLASGVNDFISAKKISDTHKETGTNSQPLSEEQPAQTATFEKCPDEQIATLPDTDGLIQAVGSGSTLSQILSNMGVSGIDEEIEMGNYHESDNIYNIDIKCTTSDNKTLLISFMYIGIDGYSNPEWSVVSIRDYDTNHFYYASDDSEVTVDLYDYKTGEPISKSAE